MLHVEVLLQRVADTVSQCKKKSEEWRSITVVAGRVEKVKCFARHRPRKSRVPPPMGHSPRPIAHARMPGHCSPFPHKRLGELGSSSAQQ